MSNAYLMIAEKALRRSREPLSPLQILLIAYQNRLVPWHLRGATQHKTLHARLSEDIARDPERSLFFRTAPGIFFLKEFLGDPTISDDYKRAYYAPPRRKELHAASILSVAARYVDAASNDRGEVEIDAILELLTLGRYRYSSTKELQEDDVPLHSFAIVLDNAFALSFRETRFSAGIDPIYRPRRLGFGSLVSADDLDLLYDSMFGVIENAISELVHAIGLPRRLAMQARYCNQLHAHFGFVTPRKRSPGRLLNVVLTYRPPEEFTLHRRTLSAAEFQWVPLNHTLNDHEDYDITSRHILTSRWAKAISA